MSAEALAIALNHSRATGTAKLVLIGIANHDGDGGAWPSIDTLARYANVDRRNVQRALDKLEQLGEVRRVKQAGGTHLTADSHRPNLYKVLLKCPVDCDRSTQHRTRRQTERTTPLAGLEAPEIGGVAVAPPHDGSATPGVAETPPGGVAVAPPEPSLELTTHLSETYSRSRAGVKAPIWSSDRCPADWKTGRHALSAGGKCAHCHEKPTAYVNRSTGEIQ